MSDVVTIAAITSGTTILGLIVTGYINSKQNSKITGKVEDYHKEVNGKMTKLLETTEALGKATGKAEEKESQKNKN